MAKRYKIEAGILVPPIRRSSKYKFLDELEVGESILIRPGILPSLQAVVQHRQKRDGKRFTRRTGPMGERWWRIA
jgi:hypothetical protein